MTQAEQDITTTLEAEGWSITSQCTNSGSPGTPSDWRVTITRGSRSHVLDYHKGAAHRRWKPKSYRTLHIYRKSVHPIKSPFERECVDDHEARERFTEPIPPTLDEVMWAITMDAEGVRHGQTFEDWCGDYGLDTDSIKARTMFDACRDEWAALTRLGADFDALTVLFENY